MRADPHGRRACSVAEGKCWVNDVGTHDSRATLRRQGSAGGCRDRSRQASCPLGRGAGARGADDKGLLRPRARRCCCGDESVRIRPLSPALFRNEKGSRARRCRYVLDVHAERELRGLLNDIVCEVALGALPLVLKPAQAVELRLKLAETLLGGFGALLLLLGALFLLLGALLGARQAVL